MAAPKTLYDPRLMERWNRRLQQFEMDELTRRLQKARRRARPSNDPKRPEKKPPEVA